MKRVLVVLGLCLGLAGCATFNADIVKLRQVYTVVTTSTVSPTTVIVTANAFDALKATATNYGRYCIQGKFVDPICSTGNRRKVVQFVRSGTAARNSLELSITTNTPATATIYNTLVVAVNGLNSTPIATFPGGSK